MTSTRFPRPGDPSTVSVAVSLPPVSDAAALAVPVAEGGEPPADLGTDAAHLAVAGFTGASGQSLVFPGADGRALVAVGIGDVATVDRTRVRDLAADFARSVPQHKSLAVELPDRDLGISPGDFAQVVVEGVLLARWRFFVGAGGDEPTLTALTIVAPEAVADEVRAGAARGESVARAAAISRDLANCPATTLSAARMGEVALELAPAAGLEVEIFGEQELIEMGCGGILGVNLGSVDEPRLIKLTYRPESPSGHLGLVGKGVMYDSGGISLKPSDESHAQMKNDMTGAAAILGAMTALQDLGLHGRGHGVPLLHRQHAVGLGDEARRRAPDAQREDRRGAQHRRRGTTGDGRRAVPGGRGRRGRRRRRRHPDRCLPAHLRRRHRRA